MPPMLALVFGTASVVAGSVLAVAGVAPDLTSTLGVGGGVVVLFEWVIVPDWRRRRDEDWG